MRTRKPLSSLLSLFLVAALAGLVVSRLGERKGDRDGGAPGSAGADSALEGGAAASMPGAPEEVPLDGARACRNVGYLCSDVAPGGTFRIMRWPDGTERLTVRVPLPAGEDPARARLLQQAAIRGILAWQGHPFKLRIEDHGAARGNEDIDVRWVRTLSGRELGVTSVDWRMRGEDVSFRVPRLALSTRRPGAPQIPLTDRQVMLTAAHEMGHALGLHHSDDPRDLMYPKNTATSLSTRDYRTLEALYALPNGTLIRP